MKKISGGLVLLFIVCFVNAQDKTSTIDAKENKAEQVLVKAHKATSKRVNVADIKGFTIISEKSRELSVGERKISQTSKVETNFALPDKIRQKTLSNQSNTQQEENFTLSGSKFYSKLDVFVDGKLQNFSTSGFDEKDLISGFKSETFLLVFPMTLDASWYIPLKFSYVGIAESKDGKAEVIEAVSAGKVKYRLFFDTETHLLLLMTQSWTDKNNKPNEKKYFFSNYQEKDGLLIATKIITERNGEVVEEKEIKDLKINPNFKSDLFEVKGK